MKCRDKFIWSFSKPFALLGAEPTDFAALVFDLKSRQVLIKIGGPDLLEAMQDPDNMIPEDGIEEV